MLQTLRIRNLALLEEAVLEFDAGFTAVTGETGAGKSVLLGALALLAGARADKTAIGLAGESCSVEGVLFLEETGSLDETLASLGLPLCEEGALVLSRSLAHSRASQVQINGRMTTLANLREISDAWIDFHGPGEPQKLFHVKWQLELLDRFARHDTLGQEFRSAYRQWRQTLRELEEVRDRDHLEPEEITLLRREIERIDGLDLSPDSVAALERDFHRLTHAQEVLSLADNAARGLGSGKEGAATRMGHHLQDAREISHRIPEAEELERRLESLIIEMADLSEEFGEIARSCTFEESEAQEIQQRMQTWLSLQRKYGGSLESVLEHRDKLRRKLAMQDDMEGVLFRLEREAEESKKIARKLAQTLREGREKAARTLETEAGRLLQSLGFRKARFSIEVVTESELTEHGDSTCRFLFAPNAGQPLLPLDKIASSGEIARVMLALKAVLARVDCTPVLVFDEVDANVGGEIGRAVGKELAALGARHQVFCVTHLPQVAALAPQHFVVTKEQTDQATHVAIDPIHADAKARLTEIARMLGDRSSKSARQHAAQLLAGDAAV